MGASLALAGVVRLLVRSEAEKIVPYVRQPEQIVPGKPLQYATAIALDGYGVGVLAESHDGRPTMVEGNALHPDSLGAIDPLVQATVLSLYDPDRSQVVTRRGEIGTWDGFLVAAIAALDAARPAKGRGVRILTETVTSPTLARLIRELLKELPEARWHQYEPVNRDAARAGARMAFGEDVAVRYDFAKADVILSLDADFLGRGPGPPAITPASSPRGASPTRSPSGMNRLYVVEPCRRSPARWPTIACRSATATSPASRRRSPASWARRSRASGPGASKEQAAVDRRRGGRPPEPQGGEPRRRGRPAAAVRPRPGARDEPGAGQRRQDRLVHRAGRGRAGRPGGVAPRLVRDMEAGQVDVLLDPGGQPGVQRPRPTSRSARRWPRSRSRPTSGCTRTRPRRSASWHVPEAHELEAWGDVRASDGTATIQQPLIAPLYGGRSAIEVVAALLRHARRGRATRSSARPGRGTGRARTSRPSGGRPSTTGSSRGPRRSRRR